MWIPRDIEPRLLRSARTRPVVVLTGARQTGKTSTFRRLFPDHEFVSLDLRHTVCSAEKSAWISLKIAGNGRNFAILARKPDWRKCPTS
jgi:hypothetical protein